MSGWFQFYAYSVSATLVVTFILQMRAQGFSGLFSRPERGEIKFSGSGALTPALNDMVDREACN